MNRLITIATPEIRPHCEGFLVNHRGYAARNGYECVQAGEPHWKDLHPSFSKVPLIHEALEDGCEFVIWADADIAFMDWSVDLAGLLDDTKAPGNNPYFLAAYQQQNWSREVYLCAGLTVWRNTETSRAFVAEWFRRCDLGTVRHNPWEQWYLQELITERNFGFSAGRTGANPMRMESDCGIRPCTGEEIGCFCPEIWHDGVIWKPGMPTVHMGGPATWARRAEVLAKIYEPQVRR